MQPILSPARAPMSRNDTSQPMKRQDGDSLGKRLRKARDAAEMTQAEFAEALGIGRAALSKWELDQRVPDATTIVDVCRLLHIPSSHLLGLDAEDQGKPFHERLKNLFRAEGNERALRILGVGTEALEAVLQGQLLIPSKTLVRMMRAYAVSYPWLLTGNPATWTPSFDNSLKQRIRFFRICVGIAKHEAPLTTAFEENDE